MAQIVKPEHFKRVKNTTNGNPRYELSCELVYGECDLIKYEARLNKKGFYVITSYLSPRQMAEEINQANRIIFDNI